MIAAVSDYLEFAPLMPKWMFARVANGYFNYYDSYYALAVNFEISDDSLVTQPNVSLQKINDYADQYLPGVDHFSGPWLAPGTEKGFAWEEIYWPLGKPNTHPEGNFDYWSAMCTGLMNWQMYSVFLCEQIVRFTQFGHYGRKHKENK